MNIPVKYRISLVVGICIEIIFFAFTVFYIIKQGRSGAEIGMLLNMPFSILALAINDMINRIVEIKYLNMAIMSLVTFFGQSAFWSTIIYWFQKLLKYFGS